MLIFCGSSSLRSLFILFIHNIRSANRVCYIRFLRLNVYKKLTHSIRALITQCIREYLEEFKILTLLSAASSTIFAIFGDVPHDMIQLL